MSLSYISTEQPNVLEDALSCAARQWPVLPLKGKIPIIKDWPKLATTDEKQILAWSAKYPGCNFGLATGKRSGVLVLDVDRKNDGSGQLEALEAIYGDLPPTVTVKTGSGGKHLYFKFPEDRNIKNAASFAPGLDIRTTGGQVVLPPGLHSNGERYAWLEGFDPDSIPLADTPEWLLDMMEKASGGDSIAAQVKPAPSGGIQDGTRNATLTSLGGTMRRRGMSEGSILAALLAENEAKCEPPLDDEEVKTIARSVSKYLPEVAEDFKTVVAFNLTDLGNAERMVHYHGKNLHYCTLWKKWLLWDFRRWELDDTAAVDRLAHDTIRRMYVEAALEIEEKERKILVKHALGSESNVKIKAMVERAARVEGVPVRPDDLDRDPWLLNCLNGTLDLRTGGLLPHRREDLITKLVPVEYDRHAHCITWLDFLNKIMNGSQPLIAFLQRSIGYALTGSTQEQVMFILHGTGANGKSTFLEAVSSMLGGICPANSCKYAYGSKKRRYT